MHVRMIVSIYVWWLTYMFKQVIGLSKEGRTTCRRGSRAVWYWNHASAGAIRTFMHVYVYVYVRTQDHLRNWNHASAGAIRTSMHVYAYACVRTQDYLRYWNHASALCMHVCMYINTNTYKCEWILCSKSRLYVFVCTCTCLCSAYWTTGLTILCTFTCINVRNHVGSSVMSMNIYVCMDCHFTRTAAWRS
jgi:hypothetical protein